MATREAVAAVQEMLGAATPAHLASLLLEIDQGLLVGITLSIGDEPETIDAETLQEWLRAEMDTRIALSEAHQGEGT